MSAKSKWPSAPSTSRRLVVAAFRVLDGLVNGEHEARRLRCGCDGVDLDHCRLPHTRLEVVGHVFRCDVHSIPRATCTTYTMQY